jgi:hypothetical protein
MIVALYGVASMPGSPRNLAERMAGRRAGAKVGDGFLRETFTEPRERARQTARSYFIRFPKQAYMSAVDDWRELPDGQIEFTMRRLPTAD